MHTHAPTPTQARTHARACITNHYINTSTIELHMVRCSEEPRLHMHHCRVLALFHRAQLSSERHATPETSDRCVLTIVQGGDHDLTISSCYGIGIEDGHRP